MFNVLIGVIWQTSLVLLSISLVTQQYPILIGTMLSVAVTSTILKFTWWNKLDELSAETMPADFDERIGAASPAWGRVGAVHAEPIIKKI